MKVETIKTKTIKRSGLNPRKINEAELKKEPLYDSIERNGVMQPLQVRRENGHFVLLAGDRRLTCAEMQNIEEVTCLVYDGKDAELYDITHFENADREDLTAFEKSADAVNLMKVWKEPATVANILGITEQQLKMRIQIQKMSKKWKKYLENNDDVPIAHLDVLSKFTDGIQNEMLSQHREGFMKFNGSASAFEKYLKEKYTHHLSMAAWYEKKCASCEKVSTTKAQSELWESDNDGSKKKMGFCLDPVCWDKCYTNYATQKVKDTIKKYPDIMLIADYLSYGEVDRIKTQYGRKPVQIEYTDRKHKVCKKNAKGAQKALYYKGPKQGSTTYIVSIRAASTGNIDGTPTVKTLAERRKGHESKIWHKTIADYAELIEGIPLSDLSTGAKSLPLLISIFGTYNNEQYLDKDQWDLLDDADTKKDISKNLFQELKEIFSSRINHRYGVTLIPDELKKEVESQCKLLKVDLQKIFEENKAGMPEPKSWANLNADGTPKEKK